MSAAALLILIAASGPPATDLECPARPGETLSYIDISDGPPEKHADLAPDWTKEKTGTTSNIWQLVPRRDGLYVQCGYGKTLVAAYTRLETIKLPDTAKSCQADYRRESGSSDLTLIGFSCR